LGAGILGLGLAVVAESSAQFKKRPQPPTTAATTDSPADDPLNAPLLSRDLVIKLRITTKQRPDIDKLQKEYAVKLKEIRDKAAEDQKTNGDPLPAAKGGKGAKGAGKGAGKGMRMAKGGGNTRGLTEAADLRNEYEDKVEELLTDAQKKIWEDIKVKQGEAALAAIKNASSDDNPKKKKKQ
jgi:hypothetical protein